MSTQSPVRPLGVLPLADGTYVVSSSDPTHAPYLIRAEGAALVCSCPAYRFRKEDGDLYCKHGQAVKHYLADREAARLRAQVRYCHACLVNPVTDGFALCETCEDQELEAAAGLRERLALSAAQGSLAARVRAPRPAPSFDYAALEQRVAAANARADAILSGGPRELQRATRTLVPGL